MQVVGWSCLRLFLVYILQGQRLMSVADVPVRGLDRLDTSCSDCHAILMLCLVLALDVLHDLLHQGRWVLAVEKESGSLHWFVVHVPSIGD